MSVAPRFPLRGCLLLALAAVAACSPTFNWRETPVGDDGLVALLPCKADRATRELPLGAERVPVQMAGCEAGGATFAIAHARAGTPAQAEAWLQAWRAATRAQLAAAGAAAASTATAAAADAATAKPVPLESTPSLARAAATPAPLRLDARGANLQVLWFAQQNAGGTALYQATVLGRPSSAEATRTFFEGLHLP